MLVALRNKLLFLRAACGNPSVALQAKVQIKQRIRLTGINVALNRSIR